MKINYGFSKDAEKVFFRLDATTAGRIMKAVLKLPSGDVRRVEGNPGLFRLRLGNWRILFSKPDSGTIAIEDISARGDAYDNL